MSSFVKVYLSPYSEVKYLTSRTEWASGITLAPTRNLMGCVVSGGKIFKGEEELSEVKAGTNFSVPIGYLESSSYNILLSANPSLYTFCSNIQLPLLIDPKEGIEVTLYGTARKAFKVEDITYWLKLYMVD